jgi:aminoglycoside phosphotransferase (APT) family kinase protein
MWDHGRLVAVIDWEDACLGDPMADMATARVELLCQYGDDAMQQFTDRYLDMATQVIPTLRLEPLVAWDLYVSASALATMGDWGLEPAAEARRRQMTEGFLDRTASELAADGPRPSGS